LFPKLAFDILLPVANVTLVRLVQLEKADRPMLVTLSGTVGNYKEEIYRCLNVRNASELMKAALRLHLVTQDELVFCHRKHALKPYPNKQITGGKNVSKNKKGRN